MNTSILFAAVCALSSVACDVSCFGECDDWSDDDCSEHHGSAGRDNHGGGSAGDNASGGRSESGGSANSGNSAGTASSGGNGGTPAVTSCVEERDCPRGFNCDTERKECLPAEAETCPELSTEAVCDNRNDCMAIYAGINCSCGADCTCKGGEPGCVCESFQFFSCEPLKN